MDVRVSGPHPAGAHHDVWGDYPSLAIGNRCDFERGSQNNLLHTQRRLRVQIRFLASDINSYAGITRINQCGLYNFY